MHILAIDVGSYSIKYISSFLDRKKITHSEMSEIILRDYIVEHPYLEEKTAQLEIVKEIIENLARLDTRIIYQFQNQALTTRFLSLPVKSKKKAELMLPFQLEEDIPYSLTEIHYAHKIEALKTQHTALVEISKVTTFEEYFNTLREKDIVPNILTTEASAVENFFFQNPMAGPFCVLDIGHRTTKAYFFYNSRLIMTHVSYMGGHHINEMIAGSYKIDLDEAIIYKHQNAFLLTSSLYSEAEATQRDFGSAMDKVFSPMVADFSRWKVGFKVNFGVSLQHVFICGGSSNIKNICPYLSEKWDLKVTLLESFDKIEAGKIDLNPKNKSKFALVNMMVQGFKRKNRFINLLCGRFTQASLSELPLHSLSFLATRVALLSIVLAVILLGERFLIHREIKQINTKLISIVKNDELGLPARIRRQALIQTKLVHDSLVKKHREIKQEISVLQSATEIKSLGSLVKISQIASPYPQVTLVDFKTTDNNEINATFQSESIEDLSRLKMTLEGSSLVDIQVTLDKSKNTLSLKAFGE